MTCNIHVAADVADLCDAGVLTVAATLLMVRMVLLLAVRRSAFCDCRGKMHTVRTEGLQPFIVPVSLPSL